MPVRASKKGRKKHKRIPLNHYEWPEDSVGDQNYKRPTTANHGQGRKRPNYDSQRREMQSRGKPIAMGLTGTSQENAEGIFVGIAYRRVLPTRAIFTNRG